MEKVQPVVLNLAEDVSAHSPCLLYCSFDHTFHTALPGSPVEMEWDQLCSVYLLGSNVSFLKS